MSQNPTGVEYPEHFYRCIGCSLLFTTSNWVRVKGRGELLQCPYCSTTMSLYAAHLTDRERDWHKEHRTPIPDAGISGPTASAESYFYGTYEYGPVLHSILTQGLFAGSSVSSIQGQATAYPIILEFGDLHVEPVYYRPGDFKLLERSGRPKAVYVYPEEFGKPVRTVDEINKDLGVLLGELEAQGLSPEEVGEMMFDYPALYKVDRRLGDLIKELNESADLEARGIMGRMGGEGVLDEVKKQVAGTGIPVYRVERDEEGEISWNARRLV